MDWRQLLKTSVQEFILNKVANYYLPFYSELNAYRTTIFEKFCLDLNMSHLLKQFHIIVFVSFCLGYWCEKAIFGTKYSRMDQVKFEESP